MKQMVYLERYGRMYIPDEALFGDTAFIRRVLADTGQVPGASRFATNNS